MTGNRCPELEAPPNTLINPIQSEYSFKDYVMFTCEPGYHLLKVSTSSLYVQVYLSRCARICLFLGLKLKPKVENSKEPFNKSSQV